MSVIDGLGTDQSDYAYLSKHAYIYTLGDLARFPQTFPYLFGILLESGVIPALEYYISRAYMLIENFKNDASGSPSLPTASSVPHYSSPSPSSSLLIPAHVTPGATLTAPRVDLSASWLSAPVSDPTNNLKFLVKPRWQDLKDVSPASPLIVLASISVPECDLLATVPKTPVTTLKDLALLRHDPVSFADVFAKVPLIEEYILHAQALVIKLA